MYGTKNRRSSRKLQRHGCGDPLVLGEGTPEDLLNRIRWAGHLAGERRGRQQAWRMAREYSNDILRVATHSRVLMVAARQVLEEGGRAAGVDGIRPGQFWRWSAYQVFRQRAREAGYAGSFPPFGRTVFKAMKAERLLLLIYLLDTERGVMLSGSFWETGEWRQVRFTWPVLDGFFREEVDGKRFGPAERTAFLVKVIESEPDARELLRCLATCIQKNVAVANMDGKGEMQPEILQDGQNGESSDDRCERKLLWMAVDWISATIRAGRYQPDHLRRVAIPKADGGERHLAIPTVLDRIVEKAVQLVVEPYCEHIFTGSVVGSRPDVGVYNVLHAFNCAYRKGHRKTLLTADLRKAYDTVPHDELEAVLRLYLPDEALVDLIMLTVRRPGRQRAEGAVDGIGIGQGQPLSPFLLNLFLHHHLDTPLRDRFGADIVYARYLDDVAVLCEGRTVADDVLAAMTKFLGPVGMEVHDAPPKTEIIDLRRKDQRASYLGFAIRGGKKGLVIGLQDRWPARFEDFCREVDKKHGCQGGPPNDDGPDGALAAVAAFMRFFGPAYECENNGTRREEIEGILRQTLGDAYANAATPVRHWQDGFRAWQTIGQRRKPLDLTAAVKPSQRPIALTASA